MSALIKININGIYLFVYENKRSHARLRQHRHQGPRQGNAAIARQPAAADAAACFYDHRRHSLVRQVLHEYATSLSAAGHANRSRRLIKCAKDSGHVWTPPSAQEESFGRLGA
jgi:hypothetical protein